MHLSGPAQSSPLWSAWLGPFGRRSGRATWTAVDPWELNFAPSTGDLLLHYVLLKWQNMADKKDFMAGLSVTTRLCEICSIIRPAVEIKCPVQDVTIV